MGEAELIRQIRCGNRHACTALVQAHYAQIFHLLARLTRDSHAAEDLCQETFAAAWAKIAGFSGGCALTTWLHQIAYRRFLDWSRTTRRRTLDTRTDEPKAARQPIDGLLLDELQVELHRALDQLDGPHRDVLVLHYLQGLTFRETAQVLDEPAATVRWRAGQALTRLREILKNDENDHDEGLRRQRTGAAAARAAGSSDSAGA